MLNILAHLGMASKHWLVIEGTNYYFQTSYQQTEKSENNASVFAVFFLFPIIWEPQRKSKKKNKPPPPVFW